MPTNKLFEILFQGAAAILILLAVYSYAKGDMDRVFVAAVLGSLCFFIGIRFQVKERLQVRSDERVSELNSADVDFAADREPEITHKAEIRE